MNIAVLGANGRSGQVFVREALAAGHQVTAAARGESLLPPHSSLKCVRADATNFEDLKRLVAGQDAVVSLLGHVKNSPANLQVDSIQKLILALREQSVERVVALTGTGVRFKGDKITLMDRFMNAAVTFIDQKRIKDGRAFVHILKDSKLDWTIIRVLKLTNTNNNRFVLNEHGPAKTFVSRLEVAKAILQVLEEKCFIKKAPIIS